MKFGRKKVSDEIPTSSMADIAFLLIIYFMVTTTFAATRGLDFALPKDEDNPPMIEKEESVLIEIQPAGNLVVDDKPMQLDKVLDYLKPKLERNPQQAGHHPPRAEAPYGAMVAVFDELRQGAQKGVEVKNISIPTQREIESFLVLTPWPTRTPRTRAPPPPPPARPPVRRGLRATTSKPSPTSTTRIARACGSRWSSPSPSTSGLLIMKLPEWSTGRCRAGEAEGLRRAAGPLQAAAAGAEARDPEGEGEEGSDPGPDSRRAGADPPAGRDAAEPRPAGERHRLRHPRGAAAGGAGGSDPGGRRRHTADQRSSPRSRSTPRSPARRASRGW